MRPLTILRERYAQVLYLLIGPEPPPLWRRVQQALGCYAGLTGIDRAAPIDRKRRLVESVQIIRDLLDGESVDYEPYDRTRSFYRSVGFSDLKSVMLDNPGMPEMLTLAKVLTD